MKKILLLCFIFSLLFSNCLSQTTLTENQETESFLNESSMESGETLPVQPEPTESGESTESINESGESLTTPTDSTEGVISTGEAENITEETEAPVNEETIVFPEEANNNEVTIPESEFSEGELEVTENEGFVPEEENIEENNTGPEIIIPTENEEKVEESESELPTEEKNYELITTVPSEPVVEIDPTDDDPETVTIIVLNQGDGNNAQILTISGVFFLLGLLLL